jgi:hypothetical protein
MDTHTKTINAIKHIQNCAREMRRYLDDCSSSPSIDYLTEGVDTIGELATAALMLNHEVFEDIED